MTNVSKLTTCLSLDNYSYMTRLTVITVIDLNPNEYDQRLHYYPFMVNLDICNGRYSSLDHSSVKYVF